MCYDLQNGFFIIDYMACGVLPNRKKGEPTSGVPPPKRPFPCRLQGGLVPPLPRPRRMPLAHRTRQRPDVPRPLPAPLARVGALLSPLVQSVPPPPRPVGMPLASVPRQTPHVPRLVSAILALNPHLACLRCHHNRHRHPDSQYSPQRFRPSHAVLHLPFSLPQPPVLSLPALPDRTKCPYSNSSDQSWQHPR